MNFNFGLGGTNDTAPLHARCVRNDKKAIDVTAGEDHSCAVLDNGRAQCWGKGGSGQLGTGLTNDYNVPTNVVGVNTFKSISAGSEHTCAVTNGKEVYCWGKNDHGQLGSGSVGGSNNSPVKVAELDNVSMVSAGSVHTCALIESGKIYCWGSNAHWTLGSDISTTGSPLYAKPSPAEVSDISNGIYISSGFWNSCAITSDKLTKCWGANNPYGWLAEDGNYIGSKIPKNISSFDNSSSVIAGTFVHCNIDSSKVYCWGNGNYGGLGNGFNTDVQFTPLEVNVSNATSLSAGVNFTCALLSDSTINCWGTNIYGQLGNGLTQRSAGPVEVSGINTAIKIDSSVEDGRHSCALLFDGRIKCWGKGDSGQLGNNSNTSSSTPVYVSGFE